MKELFAQWLEQHVPLKAEHVMSLIRQSRQGRDNDSTFGRRQRGTGEYARLIGQRFSVAARKHGLAGELPCLDTTRFEKPRGDDTQLSLF